LFVSLFVVSTAAALNVAAATVAASVAA